MRKSLFLIAYVLATVAIAAAVAIGFWSDRANSTDRWTKAHSNAIVRLDRTVTDLLEPGAFDPLNDCRGIHDYASALLRTQPPAKLKVALTDMSNGGTACSATQPRSYGIAQSYKGLLKGRQLIGGGSYEWNKAVSKDYRLDEEDE